MKPGLRNSLRFGAVVILISLMTAGCVVIPKDLLVLPPNYLQNREIQMKKFETTDEMKIVKASAGVLQDLGFTIDKSESQLGMIVCSKNRTAVNGGQIAAALALDVLAAMGGATTNAYSQTDKEQQIQGSMIILPSLTEGSTVVRVKFQRIVWNRMGQVSRFEMIHDPILYQDFFEKLTKSVFLEEHKI